MSQLSASAIAAVLTTRRLGRPTIHFPQIGSTHDVAHEWASAGAGDGLLVIADEQTAGRGRLDRRWWAPPGTCLLISLLLRPELPLACAGQLTMCLGLGAVEGIEQVTGLHAMLKWPNDLLLNDRKLGGMLTELRANGDRLHYAVLGLGLNVNLELPGVTPLDASTSAPPPPELAEIATSLSSVLLRPVDRLTLLAAILAAGETWYDRLLLGEAPHTAWAARLDTLGRRVTVMLPLGTLVGEATGVTPEGAMTLRDDAGREHVVWGGDVVAVRPTYGRTE